MRNAVLIGLYAAVCFAGQARKPVCNAQSQGQFWPEEANVNRDAMREHYQQGDLEMCSRGEWRYKWEHLSVNVRQLRLAKHAADSNAAKRVAPQPPPTAAAVPATEGASMSRQ
jgi:hypothetical protein